MFLWALTGPGEFCRFLRSPNPFLGTTQYLMRHLFKVGLGKAGYPGFRFFLRRVFTEACIQRYICQPTYIPASMIPQIETQGLPEVFTEGLKLSNDCVWSRAIETPDRGYQSGNANKCFRVLQKVILVKFLGSLEY